MVICGLEKGKSRGLEIRHTKDKGRSVFATEAIPKSTYVTEYKYDKLYPFRDREKYEREYEANDEGCFVLNVYVKGKKMCMDATRRLYCYGR